MSDVLLTLNLPNNIAEQVEDLLLAHPEQVRGFTSREVDGHGANVQLHAPAELVSGHAPRTQIQIAGPETDMRALLALLKTALPRANIFYWLTPIIAMGHV
jgi:hypothetical protein